MKGFEYVRSVILWSLVLCALYVFPSWAAVYVLDPASAPEGLEVGPASPSDAIVPFSSYPGVYDGSMSTSVVSYMRGIAARFRPGTHYVLFRQSQYVYRLVYGSDLEVSGFRFLGTGLDYITYDTRYYAIDEGHEGDFSLIVNNNMVYTDLESMYPVLIEGGSVYIDYAILFCLTALLLYLVCKQFFSTGGYTI